MKKNIRYITDGALIVAIYAIFLLVCRFFSNGLEESVYFILPIPLIIYGSKYNLKDSLIVLLATIGLSFLLINPFNALFYILPTCILGVVYPLLEKRRLPISLQVLIVTLFYFLINLFTMVIFAHLLNYDIVEDCKSLVESFAKLFSNLNVSYLEALMISIIPSTIIITSILDGILLIVLSKVLLYKLKLTTNIFFLNLTFENFPRIVGFIYIIVFVLMMFSTKYIPLKDNLYIFWSIILNIGIVFSFLMIYQGLFLVGKYCKVRNKKWLYILTVISVFIFPFISIFLGLIQNIFHLSNKIF